MDYIFRSPLAKRPTLLKLLQVDNPREGMAMTWGICHHYSVQSPQHPLPPGQSTPFFWFKNFLNTTFRQPLINGESWHIRGGLFSTSYTEFIHNRKLLQSNQTSGSKLKVLNMFPGLHPTTFATFLHFIWALIIAVPPIYLLWFIFSFCPSNCFIFFTSLELLFWFPVSWLHFQTLTSVLLPFFLSSS